MNVNCDAEKVIINAEITRGFIAAMKICCTRESTIKIGIDDTTVMP
ncbi:hypothetical protein SAMN05444277_11752 [Parafilimonas terrae]|jgi:hypothetical protein|uniref:Uncharacterized protein n=1 Tax=Parafilimonas terrae TaxID=1465490 RepID=A0A1I5Z7H6_9BACT|nr:hypothetical protein SAMN05444277_11752 [Parafilimonas terrae]